MKELAIVILNWNGKDFLVQFLPSLLQHSAGYTIIVADNDSTDDSISFLAENYPTVQLIKNKENGGFARGYNEALVSIKGTYSYYMLINSDVEVTTDWINPLLNTIKKEDLFAVQPKIRSFHSRGQFEYAGAAGGFLDINYYPFCRGRLFSELEDDHGQYDNTREVFWASGACFMVNADQFHQLGGFDADFFAHMEEIDLCWRAKLRGFRIKICPYSTVYHVGGGTLNYGTPTKTYLNFRNSLFMIYKNHHGNVGLKITWRMVLDGIAGLQFLTQLKGRHCWAIIRAHIAFYRNLSTLNKKRAAIQANKQKPNMNGWYKGSILFSYFVKGVKSYRQLNKRLFIRD